MLLVSVTFLLLAKWRHIRVLLLFYSSISFLDLRPTSVGCPCFQGRRIYISIWSFRSCFMSCVSALRNRFSTSGKDVIYGVVVQKNREWILYMLKIYIYILIEIHVLFLSYSPKRRVTFSTKHHTHNNKTGCETFVVFSALQHFVSHLFVFCEIPIRYDDFYPICNSECI